VRECREYFGLCANAISAQLDEIELPSEGINPYLIILGRAHNDTRNMIFAKKRYSSSRTFGFHLKP
jgi:hypothetical protein